MNRLENSYLFLWDQWFGLYSLRICFFFPTRLFLILSRDRSASSIKFLFRTMDKNIRYKLFLDNRKKITKENLCKDEKDLILNQNENTLPKKKNIALSKQN